MILCGHTLRGWLRVFWNRGPRHLWFMSTNRYYRDAQREDLSFLDEPTPTVSSKKEEEGK